MTKIAIASNASGSGTFTIAAPNSNTSRTFTLPDETGSVLTDQSSLPAANLTGTLPAIDGSALTNLPASGLGIGQTWQTVTRTVNVTYQNTTGKTIVFNLQAGNYALYVSSGPSNANFLLVGNTGNNIGAGTTTAIIPNGHYYYWQSNGGYLSSYVELR